jgi:uncharacterized protein YuzE
MLSTELMRPARRLLQRFGMAEPHALRSASAALGALHFKYDEDADLLFARLGEPEVCDNVQVDDYVVVRLSRSTHQPVGIEVVGVSERFHKTPSAINRTFARQLLNEFGPAAQARLRKR